MYKRIRNRLSFVALETRRGLKPKCVPQFFRGPLLRTRRSAIRDFIRSNYADGNENVKKSR